MAQLRTALSEAGLEEVRTYIQSGNVIARSPLATKQIEQVVHRVIAEHIGADITVIARTSSQLNSVLQHNPFAQDDLSRVYFSLLASTPESSLTQAMQEMDTAPDRIRIVGDTLYTLYATRLSDSRYTNNYFERKLKVAATTRNFNTLSRLVALSNCAAS